MLIKDINDQGSSSILFLHYIWKYDNILENIRECFPNDFLIFLIQRIS